MVFKMPGHLGKYILYGWRRILVGPQNGICVISPVRHLEF